MRIGLISHSCTGWIKRRIKQQFKTFNVKVNERGDVITARRPTRCMVLRLSAQTIKAPCCIWWTAGISGSEPKCRECIFFGLRPWPSRTLTSHPWSLRTVARLESLMVGKSQRLLSVACVFCAAKALRDSCSCCFWQTKIFYVILCCKILLFLKINVCNFNTSPSKESMKRDTYRNLETRLAYCSLFTISFFFIVFFWTLRKVGLPKKPSKLICTPNSLIEINKFILNFHDTFLRKKLGNISDALFYSRRGDGSSMAWGSNMAHLDLWKTKACTLLVIPEAESSPHSTEIFRQYCRNIPWKFY